MVAARLDRRRSGFTLLELMIVSAIMVLVLGGMATLLIGSHRMMKEAYATAELSLQLRMLREKLLFRVDAPGDSTLVPGVLSGTNGATIVKSQSIRMHLPGVDARTGALVGSVPVEIKHADETNGGQTRRFLYNAESTQTKWLRPVAEMDFVGEATIDYPIVDVIAEDNFFFIDLTGSVESGFGGRMTRKERIAVPVFGTVQLPPQEGNLYNEPVYDEDVNHD